MIQDIYPHKLNNSFNINHQMKDDDYILHFDGRKVALIDSRVPRIRDVSDTSGLVYLFVIDDIGYYLSEKEIEGCEYFDIMQLSYVDGLSKEILFGLHTGKHLADWYRDSKYCGRCGKKMSHSENERAMVCECGNTVYPRIMPAVIVGVKNGDELLLTKYSKGFKYNALIAGFVEIGETIEECVQREVMEEAGIKVKNITYYKSQPWGMANDILVGYYCELDGDGTIKIDENELKEAVWTKREDIELQPGSVSMTNEMMKMFKEGIIK